MFSFCSNQVELAVLTLYISTNKLLVQSAVYIIQNIDKYFVHIDTKVYLYCF